MKFDSYPRFLKSDLYKECLSGNVAGPRLDAGLLVQPQTPSKLKKSLSNAEDRRRKSLLPWHRKNRSKSKDRGESEYNRRNDDGRDDARRNNDDRRSNDERRNKNERRNNDGRRNNDEWRNNEEWGNNDDRRSNDERRNNDERRIKDERRNNDERKINDGRRNETDGRWSDLHGSKSSVASTEPEEQKSALCRVILNKELTSVVQIRDGETIDQLIARVLEKRGLNFRAYEVFIETQTKPLNTAECALKLAGLDVLVEQRVVFKLDLPNKKIIAVKSKCTKIIVDVLRPILHKYNYRLEDVFVTTKASEEVDVKLPVTAIDGVRLNVQLAEECVKAVQKETNSLDEITNKCYEDILQEKSDAACLKMKSDKGSVKVIE